MTQFEQQIFNDLSTAGWDIFQEPQAKKEVAQHLTRLGYQKYDEEALINKIANYLEQENNWHNLKHAWLVNGKSDGLRNLLREAIKND